MGTCQIFGSTKIKREKKKQEVLYFNPTYSKNFVEKTKKPTSMISISRKLIYGFQFLGYFASKKNIEKREM